MGGRGDSYDLNTVPSHHRGGALRLWLLSLPPDVTVQLLQLMRREDNPRQEGLLRGAGGGGRGQRVEGVDSDRTLVGCVNTLTTLQ